ncbi:GNAT family N-acetyltransferase [Actinomadura sp. 6N118]
MFAMRPATSADRAAVEKLLLARCAWMEERGIPSWRASVDDLVSQCDNLGQDVWILDLDGSEVVGRMTVQRQAPPWGWTEKERSEDAFYLTTTVTDPAHRHLKPGTLMAWWAVDRAMDQGIPWVRRDCLWPGLVAYNRSQGFTLVREAQWKKNRLYLLARRTPCP